MGHLVLFVVTADGVELDDDLRRRIAAVLKNTLSPRHLPDHIIGAPEVPYNLTGKKLEVPVKRMLSGEPRERVISPGALRNPDSINFYEQVAAQFLDRVTV
jgi:acetoacetyl-CoA synthetase